MRGVVLLASALAATACGEGALPLPKDPGTVRVIVRDERDAPVASAAISIVVPNSVGSFYTISTTTRSDGTSTLAGIPAGTRTVAVTPPPGYVASDAPLSQAVRVVRGETVEVRFALRRSP